MITLAIILLIISAISYAGLFIILLKSSGKSMSDIDLEVLKEIKQVIDLVNKHSDHISELIKNNNLAEKIFGNYNSAFDQISKNQRNFDTNIKQLRRELAAVQVFLQDDIIYKGEE